MSCPDPPRLLTPSVRLLLYSGWKCVHTQTQRFGEASGGGGGKKKGKGKARDGEGGLGGGSEDEDDDDDGDGLASGLAHTPHYTLSEADIAGLPDGTRAFVALRWLDEEETMGTFDLGVQRVLAMLRTEDYAGANGARAKECGVVVVV